MATSQFENFGVVSYRPAAVAGAVEPQFGICLIIQCRSLTAFARDAGNSFLPDEIQIA